MENTVKNTGKEKSDMLTMLENLERMFDAIRYCVNEKARETLLMAMAIEAETLALKMSVMYQRWNVYLPFDENMDVDFDVWDNKVCDWLKVFAPWNADASERYPRFRPNDSFWLDLYRMNVCDPTLFSTNEPLVFRPYDTDEFAGYDWKNPFHYSCRFSELLDEMRADEHHVDEISSNCMSMLKKYLEMQDCQTTGSKVCSPERQKQLDELFAIGTAPIDSERYCCETLQYLNYWLAVFEFFLNSQLSDEQFERLCDYVLLNLPGEIDSRAKINQWQNSWPSSVFQRKAQEHKVQLQDQLRGTRWGKELEEYLNLDAPLLTNNADFGRFLFKNRKELDMDEIEKIYLLCQEIQLLNEIIYPKEEKVTDDPTLNYQQHTVEQVPTQPRQLNKVEQQILDRLMELAEKGDWTQGATVESIQAGLKRALGVGDPLPEELQAQSEQLWVLFKKRDNCDAEKSLRVTWLNIAGWSVNKRILKGGTDNDICKRFFPNCGDKDYMNVSRGRKDSVKTFVEIHKLLETCLLPKQS